MSEIKPRKITIGTYSMSVGKSKQVIAINGRRVEIVVDSIELIETSGYMYYQVIRRVVGGEETFPWKQFINGMIIENDIGLFLE